MFQFNDFLGVALFTVLLGAPQTKKQKKRPQTKITKRKQRIKKKIGASSLPLFKPHFLFFLKKKSQEISEASLKIVVFATNVYSSPLFESFCFFVLFFSFVVFLFYVYICEICPTHLLM